MNRVQVPDRGRAVNRDAVDHEPVLCGPVLSIVAPRPGEVVVDATLGHGGHSRMIAGAIGPAGRLIALDVDDRNIARARSRLPVVARPAPQPGEGPGPALQGGTSENDAGPGGAPVGTSRQAGGETPGQEAPTQRNGEFPRVDIYKANFSELDTVLDTLNVPQVDVILADLGVSTDQLLDSSLGLTFTQDGPLDMRLDDRLETTAGDLLNSLSERELSDLIWDNSQERFSRRIAKAVCHARRAGRIKRTSELVHIVQRAMGLREGSYPGRIHPATRTFLALRMAVNHELQNLRALLEIAARRLRIGGRVAVISFHSGEDRIVKQDFLDRQRAGVYLIRTKKPVAASAEEIARNPRSRSSKLRVAERAA
jgi:16S rRNA (cytosine1402-N4)-methyltransferase